MAEPEVICLSDTEVSLQQRSPSGLHYGIYPTTKLTFYFSFLFGPQERATSSHDIRVNPIDMEDEGRLVLNRRSKKLEHQKDGKRALEKRPRQPKQPKQRAREEYIIRETCHPKEENERQLYESATPDSSDKEEADNMADSSSSPRREKRGTPLKKPKKTRRGPARQFTHAEDTRLMNAICKHGASWTKIAAEVANERTADTCNKRYRLLVKYAFKGAGWTI